jgi:hypothetical protein
MKNDTIKNSIIYTGEKHCLSLKEYVENIGFELKLEKQNTKEEVRCVKDILHFKDFFLD